PQQERGSGHGDDATAAAAHRASGDGTHGGDTTPSPTGSSPSVLSRGGPGGASPGGPAHHHNDQPRGANSGEGGEEGEAEGGEEGEAWFRSMVTQAERARLSLGGARGRGRGGRGARRLPREELLLGALGAGGMRVEERERAAAGGSGGGSGGSGED